MIDKGLYKDQRLTKNQQKKIKPVVQAGTKNFLGKQEMVTVPKKWLSSSDHVVAELAYITPREQKILIDKNLYGSLKGKPNVGPGGIMSLQGGDSGGIGSGFGGGDKGGSGKGRDRDFQQRGMTATDYASGVGANKDGSRDQNFSGKKTGFEKVVDFYNKLPTPLNLAKKVFTNLGPFNNKDFYNEKVVPAGKTNLNYDDYMSARMAGKIDAYGNEINNRGGRDGARNNLGIMEVSNVTPIAEDENEENNQTAKNYDFNYGTASNPVLYSDLV